jgi:DNA-binding transcriptional LysR family regulator
VTGTLGANTRSFRLLPLTAQRAEGLCQHCQTAEFTPSTVEDLADYDCIRPAKQGPSGTWRLGNADGSTRVQVSGRFAANTGQAQIKAAIAGLGICLQPIGALRQALASGELVQVLPGVASAAVGLYVVYPSRRHVPRTILSPLWLKHPYA